MDALSARVIECLGRAELEPEAFARAGDPSPEQAARAFRAAAGEPELHGCPERWVPDLLHAARPGFGAQCLAELAALLRREGPAPLDLRHTPCVPALLAGSNFLARQLLRRPGWVGELAGATPDAPVAAAPAADWDAIRAAKYRGLLRIGARDLAGRPFEASLGELSDLADRCLVAALAAASDDCGAAAPALLALGKLGGRELNFSSDVDLIFVYHPSADEDPLVQNQATAQLIRRLKQQLELPTAEGFGYRVDLDLRPEGRSGVLANSVEAALSYYESFGAEWERQALLRLRAVAGAPQAAADFERGIVPFVYRRLIDPETMQRVHEMKARIEEERRRAGKDIDADLKEGPGGIRDVEFLTQALQLLYGGREPEVRGGNVLAALRALERLRLLPEATCEALRAAYLWLRRAEHALQLAEEQQTARFPRDGVAQTALARRMGYADELASDAQARMLDEWTAVRGSVRAHFEALVLRAEA